MLETDQRLLARAVAVARGSIPSCDWAAIASRIAADRTAFEQRLRKPVHEIDTYLEPGLETFTRDAVIVHPMKLEAAKVAEIRRHLETQTVHKGYHVYWSDRQQCSLEEARQAGPFAGYTMDQLMRTPHLIDFFNHPAIVDFVEMALGCVPTLYSINAWWSFPATTPTGHGAQFFHRDDDDWRFITMFLYLTDVDEEAGPHQLIKGSHTLEGMTALIEKARARGEDVPIDALASFSDNAYFTGTFSSTCDRAFKNETANIVGPAGTIFMANTVAAHRGLMPNKKPRLIAWARFGMGPNTNSANLEQGPLARSQVRTVLPDTPRNRYVNRLLFEFDRRPGLQQDSPDTPRQLSRIVSSLRGRFS
jgi:hypothetical protein